MDGDDIPELGAAIRHEWDLDPAFVTVNHGSFGATPRAVLDAQTIWRRRMEAQPTRFMAAELTPALRRAAATLAAFLGVAADDLAFVANATTGCNAVLRSLRLDPGDEIVVLAHGYGAVRNTVRHVTAMARAGIVEVPVPFPDFSPAAMVANVAAALTERTRLVVVDHITSQSALLMPLPDIVAICRDATIPVLVDGAHAPGHISLDLEALGADYYVGNCHKWLMAPKGCAFLHVRRDRQADLHPVTISHGYEQGFLSEFDWTGTGDPSGFLAVDSAIAFHQRLGGATLNRRNAALAGEGARIVAQHIGGAVLAVPILAMSLVGLPSGAPATVPTTTALRARLLEAGTDAPVPALAGQAWLRLSAQAYNCLDDYEAVAGLLRRILTG